MFSFCHQLIFIFFSVKRRKAVTRFLSHWVSWIHKTKPSPLHKVGSGVIETTRPMATFSPRAHKMSNYYLWSRACFINASNVNVLIRHEKNEQPPTTAHDKRRQQRNKQLITETNTPQPRQKAEDTSFPATQTPTRMVPISSCQMVTKPFRKFLEKKTNKPDALDKKQFTNRVVSSSPSKPTGVIAYRSKNLRALKTKYRDCSFVLTTREL